MKRESLMVVPQQFMKPAKQALRNLVESTPILTDYYYYYWLYSRNPNLYRDVFSSFSEAIAAAPQGARIGYNYTDLYDSRLKDLTEVERFNPIHYPILVWLRQAFKDSSTVLDLGGTTGYSYYAYRRYISYPENLHWTVCEVPAIAEVGKKLSTLLPSSGLDYITNVLDGKGQIFFSHGMLQYFEESLATILSQLAIKPRHLIINHVPFYEGDDYVTLQRLSMVRSQGDFVSYIPFKVQNRAKFINDLAKMGYRLIDSWQQDRKCFIPFHPERFVDAFHGFYLRHESSDALSVSVNNAYSNVQMIR